MLKNKKIMAILMIIVLMGANLLTLGNQVIAANLPAQNSKTNHANVEFNSYFDDEQYSQKFDISKDANLNIMLKVKNAGYLKNIVISISDTNFEIDTQNLKNEKVQKASENQIQLEQITSGNEVEIKLPIKVKTLENIEKDFLEKATKVTLSATYVDGNGKEKQIEKEIINQVIWEANAELELTSQVTKYVPYNQNEEYGVLVQTMINSNLKDHILPVLKTQIEMNVPEINGEKPQRVNVIANQTTSTNNDITGTYFTEQNYSYEEGKLTIQTTNQEENLSWNKQGIDQYLINFVYVGKEIYDEVAQKGMNTTAQIIGTITIPNQEQTQIEKNIETNYQETETKGMLTEVDLKADQTMSKGNLYANYDREQKQEIPYEITYRVQINDTQLTDEIKIQTKPENYQDEEENNYPVEGYVKQIKIEKDNFIKMLSEEGTIEILNSQNEVIATINQETEQDENENYVINLENNNKLENQLIIKTSTPVSEGNLQITVEKALNGEQNYTKEQMQNFEKITLGVILKQEKLAQIELLETTSKAEISIEQESLSTVVENENVEIRTILDIASLSNTLYKNPTLKITLPEVVKEVKINNASLLMDNGLTIKNTKVTTENNKKIIYVELEGVQTEYLINAEYKGTILVLNTNITLKDLAPTSTEKITLNYTNQNEKNTNFVGTSETTINIVAPTGVVAANGISNYAQNRQAIMAITAQNQNATIETHTEKKIATVTGKIVNNYGNKITDVVILGRLPSKDNKKIDSEEELGSTFDATLNTELKVTGVQNYQIYYSEKVDASRDLENSENGWKTTATSATKSYMIVTNNYEMETGATIDFEYNIEIPENLSYNNSSYEMYKVYYNNVSSVGTMQETKISPVIGVATGQGPELEVSLSRQSEEAVREGQIIKLIATVKNVGGLTATNSKLKIIAPEGTVHTEMQAGTLEYTDSTNPERTITLGEIKPGETITQEYELKIEKPSSYEGEKEISNTVSILADNISGEIKSEALTIKVLQGELRIVNIPTVSEEEVLKQGKNITYKIKVENISNEKDLNNVTVKMELPTGIKINDVYYGDSNSLKEKTRENININENNISVNLGTLNSIYAYMNNNNQTSVDEPQIVKLRTSSYIAVECTVEDYVGTLTTMATATADGIEEHYSNVKTNTAQSVNLKIMQSALNNQYIKEGSQYSYSFTVQNIGQIASVDNKIELELPEGLSFVKAEYTYNGKTTTKEVTDNGKITITLYELQPEEKLDLVVTVKANELPDQNEKQVTTVATLEASGFEKIESNKVTAIIEYSEANHQNGNQNMVVPTTSKYKITGTAWLDENKNGEREETEKLLSNIGVALVYKKDSKIVTDANGNQKRTITNSKGIYEFNDIPAGEYLVIFLYDAGNYSLTTYQAAGVANTVNSDAIDLTTTFDGEQRVVGITDAIKITDSNARDIDIGLYVAQKFDLKLDKYITKITRTTPTSGTDTFNYNNSKIQKIEVLSKNVNKSSIIVEYKMVVTNEGGVAGYARKIVDYLPENAKFTAEMNQDWYLADNSQSVYNTSLADVLINPGESKEITLVLSYNITDKNIGNTINNNAEIYEIYNEQGLKDIDSTPANKVEAEDDMSNADIVIGVVTGGQIVITTALIFAVTILLGFGVFEIKKHVLKIKIS